MAKETSWFGPGSRIIITSQEQKFLRTHGVEHIYKVDLPRKNVARQIFCMYAFGQEFPKDGFEMLVEKVIEFAGELPLGLRVLGSYFRGMSKEEWQKSMPRLKSSLNADIHNILKFSYDALDDEDKYLFLHIACLFNHETIERVENCLATQFLEVRQRIKVLAEKSLISFDEDWGYVHMETLLEKLGREIVRKQEPGQRRFLMEKEEILDLLSGEAAGSEKVICIQLDYKGEEFDISERAFEGVYNLQFLFIYPSRFSGFGSVLKLPRGLKYLSRKLRVLHWFCLPLTCLPSTMSFEFLVELFLQYSELEKLWEGIKPLRNLKIMNLSYSKNLRELPDLSTATNLVNLYLTDCINLVELPTSIGYAKSLEKLILRGCSELIKLPSWYATNLKELDFGGCRKLLELPSFIWNAINLQVLGLSMLPNLLEVPFSIGNLTSLETLNLDLCCNLRKLPSSIGNLHKLKYLKLESCINLRRLPCSIGNLHKLKVLNLHGCYNLSILPDTINLESLMDLSSQAPRKSSPSCSFHF